MGPMHAATDEVVRRLRALSVSGQVRGAGHPHPVFPTSFDELVRITGATPMAVGVDG